MELEPGTANEVWYAIGFVTAMTSALSYEMERVAIEATGTELTGFMLMDAPMGVQARQVIALLEQANSPNPYIKHPPIDEEMRSTALTLIRAISRQLIPLRNRVVHDGWTPTQQAPGRVEGFRQVRFGREHIETTTQSMMQIGDVAFAVTAALCAVSTSIEALRRRSREELRLSWRNPIDDAERYTAAAEEKLRQLRDGTLEDWLWETHALPKSPGQP